MRLLLWLILGALTLQTLTLDAQCPVVADAGPDQVLCNPGTATLAGNATGAVLSYRWFPDAGLSDPEDLNTTVNITGTTTYTLRVYGDAPGGPNLIVNGDFEAGNAGIVSDYAYQPPTPTALIAPGTYTVASSPDIVSSNLPPCVDHTSGAGNAMLIHANTNTNARIWCQTVAVQPNTYYFFEGFATAVNPLSTARIQLQINSANVGGVIDLNGFCNWTQFDGTWFSGSATSATICILNRQNAAFFVNALGLDDLSFRAACFEEDQVTLTVGGVNAQATAPAPWNCNADPNTCLTLSGAGSTTGANVSYQWTTSNGDLQGATDAITATACAPGTYTLQVTLTTPSGQCQDTVSVQVISNNQPPPTFNLGGQVKLCEGATLQVAWNNAPAYLEYAWTHSVDVLLQNGQFTPSAEFAFPKPGTFSVCLNAKNRCGLVTQACKAIEVNAKPAKPVVTGSRALCDGIAMVSYKAISNGASTWSWSTTDTLVKIISGALTDSVRVDWGAKGVGPLCVTASNACGDSTYCFQVQRLKSDSLFLQQNLCEGDSLLFNQRWIKNSGIYRDTLMANNSSLCDTLVLLQVNLRPAYNSTVFKTTCNPSGAGTQVFRFTSQWGCDSTITQVTELLPSDTTRLFLWTCNPSNEGLQVGRYPGSTGCDSIVLTQYTYAPADTLRIVSITCDLAKAGTTITRLVNQFGCDSIRIHEVQWRPGSQTVLQQTSCDPGAAGIKRLALKNQWGCDSLVTIITRYVEADTTLLNVFTCDASQAGRMEDLYTSAGGCDSLVITQSLYIPTDTTLLRGNTCIAFHAGVTETYLQNQFGCDSLILQILDYVPLDTTYIERFTCNAFEAGEQLIRLVSMEGCDSLILETVRLNLQDTTRFFSTSCDPNATGIFVAVLPGSDQCDSTIIRTIAYSASDTTALIITTCDFSQAGIQTDLYQNILGCDSLVIKTYVYSPPDTTQLLTRTCRPDLAGVQVLTFQNARGCDSIVIHTAMYEPLDTVRQFSVTCDPQLAGSFQEVFTNFQGCDSVVIKVVTLLQSDTTLVTSTTCDPSEVQTSQQWFTNQWGCDSLVITQVVLGSNAACSFQAYVFSDTIYCTQQVGNLRLRITEGLGPFEFQWAGEEPGPLGSGTIPAILQDVPIPGLEPGKYEITVTDQQGQTRVLLAEIVKVLLDIPLQVQSLTRVGNFDLRCAGDRFAIVNAYPLKGFAPYQYRWSNGSQLNIAQQLGAGPVTVTITDRLGCMGIDTFQVTEPPALNIASIPLDETCAGVSNGSLEISVQGGIGPYLITLNNFAISNNSVTDNLVPGVFSIEVTDANGCTLEASETIGQGEIVQLPQLPDLEVAAGTPVLFSAPAGNWASWSWNGSCGNCAVFDTIFNASGQVILEAVSPRGCTASQIQRVLVLPEDRVITPKVFSPNGDGKNETFFLLATPGTLTAIQEFQVFDRWGALVHQAFGLSPNDPYQGWNGTHKGYALNPGVYVWQATVLYSTGKTDVLHGEVTLVR